MFGHLRDSINPRGAEYGVTSRAARAAEQTAENTDDLFELELAAVVGNREDVARQIISRRAAYQRRRVWWHRLDLIATAILVAGIAIYMLAPAPGVRSNADSGAVTRSAPSPLSSHARHAPTPVRSAYAPAITAAVDRAEARGDVDPDNDNIVYLSNKDADYVAAHDPR